MAVAPKFEPIILGFLCNWCSYAGADLAGVSRIQYASNLRPIRVMCSGRVDPIFIIEGFLAGADGIMVLGCHPGDCHYSTGNFEAFNMYKAVGQLLDCAGVRRERLLIDWVSASEGMRFRELVESFIGQVKELGPLGSAEGKNAPEVKFVLEAARRVTQSEKFRWVMSKQTEFMKVGNEYGERFTRHEMDRALEGISIESLIEHKISLVLAEEPLSVRQISERVNLLPSQVLRYVAGLQKKGAVAIFDIQGTSPLYCATSRESA